MNFNEHLAKKLSSIINLSEEEILSLFEVPPESTMGDLAFPCFILSKQLRKAPNLIAAELALEIKPDEIILKANSVGGYVNVFYNRAAFFKNVLGKIENGGERYGSSSIGEGKTVLVEFSSPNIAKPFHIGHLFSTSVGHSLSKIYEFLGYNTIRLNHLGDWGTQFGKLICAYKRWGNKEIIEKNPISELLKIYVKFHDEAHENPALEDEARAYFKQLEDNDEEVVALWRWFRDASLKEFERVYDELGVKFDSYDGEAFYSDKMQVVVDELKEKNLLEESQGAQVVSLDDLPPCIILKSDGASIYATRDLAAAIYRNKTYNFHKNIYVVGGPQALHFRQIFATLKKMGKEWSDDCVHVAFGTVKFPDKKLSTRSGDVVLLEEVLDEAIKKTKDIIEQNNTQLDDKDDVAKKVGIGAILYTFLKNGREKDIVFKWEDILDFEGESGPYVQYTYARAQSVLRKADIDYKSPDFNCLCTDDEYNLVKLLNGFSDAVQDAANKYEPFYINRYVTNLARAFNKFYNAQPILKADEEVKKARLLLVHSCCFVIKAALALLGIEVVEKM